MATKLWTGSAGAVSQIQTWTPGQQPRNTVATITCNGKSLTYTSATGTNDDIVAGVAAAVKGSTIPEFQEVTFVAALTNPLLPIPNATYAQIGCVTVGKPVTVTISLSTPPTVSVVRTTPGKPGVNETQQIAIGPNGQAGSFTFTWSGQTTGAIPLPPQPLAAASGAAGNVAAGVYKYVVTSITANGETEAGPATSITLGSAVQVNLTAVATGAATVTARKIYRTKAGGSVFYLLTTVNDNTTTTYTDNTADANLGVTSPPQTNFAFEGAVQALSNVGANNFKVGGANLPAVPNTDPTKQVVPAAIVYTYSFVGTLGNASQAMATANVGNITVLPTITVAETQAGYPIQSAIQQVGWQQVIGSAAPSGNLRLTLPGLGITTAQIPFNAAAPTILAAIQAAAPPAYANSFAVSSASATTLSTLWNISYQGILSNQSIPQIQIDISGMSAANNDTLTAVQKQTQVGSATGQDETVTVTINNSPTGGLWYLDVVDPGNNNTVLIASTGIAASPTAAAVQTALGGASLAEVSGSTGGPFTIGLVGELGSKKLSVLWASNLTGSGPAAGSPPGSNTTGISPPSNLNAFQDIAESGLAAGTAYYYKVTAINTLGETIASNEANATTTATPSSILLTWAQVTGATGYKVYRGTAAGSENTLLFTTTPAAANYTAGTAQALDCGGTNTASSPPGVNTAGISSPTVSYIAGNNTGGLSAATYYYKVTATNVSGETTPSAEVSVAINGTSYQSVFLKWGAVTGATGYKVYRGTAAGSENTLVATILSGNEANGFIDVGPTNTAVSPPVSNTTSVSAPVQNATTPSASGGTLASATYYYKITATNAQGETTGSNEQSAIVTGPTGSVTLSWNAATGATGYKIYRGTASGGENSMIAQISGGATVSFIDTNGIAATIVIVETAVGAAAVNEVQTVTINGATGGSFELAAAGNASSPIAYNSTAAAAQATLQALLGSGNITLAGAAGGPFTCTYAGVLAGSPQPLLTPIAGSLTGSATAPQTLATVQAATGPNFWDNAQNWFPTGVPVNGDDVWFQFNKVPCQYNLAQSAVTLNSLHADMSYTAGLGLPLNNGKYFEYRLRFLQIGVTNRVEIGKGPGGGPSLVNLDFGTTAFQVSVSNTGNPTDTSTPVVNLKGARSAGSSTLDVKKGRVGVATFAGDLCTVDTIRESYVSNQTSDASIYCGEGATLATIQKDGGDATINGSFTSLTSKGGTLTWNDTAAAAATATLLDIQAGTVIHNATGNVTTTKVGARGKYDRSQKMQPVQLGTLTLIAGATFNDPHGQTSWSGGLTLSECGLEDVTLVLGKNISIPSRTQL